MNRIKKIIKSNYFLPFVIIEFLMTITIISEFLKMVDGDEITTEEIITALVAFSICQIIVFVLLIFRKKLFKYDKVFDIPDEEEN